MGAGECIWKPFIVSKEKDGRCHDNFRCATVLYLVARAVMLKGATSTVNNYKEGV